VANQSSKLWFASGGYSQGRIKRGQWGQLPQAPAARYPPWWNLFVSNKILVWKIFVVQKRYKNTTLYYIPMLRKYQRPPTQNRRQKVVNRGALHSNLIKIPLIYIVSYFNLGDLELCLGGISPPKPPAPIATDFSELISNW